MSRLLIQTNLALKIVWHRQLALRGADHHGHLDCLFLDKLIASLKCLELPNAPLILMSASTQHLAPQYLNHFKVGLSSLVRHEPLQFTHWY